MSDYNPIILIDAAKISSAIDKAVGFKDRVDLDQIAASALHHCVIQSTRAKHLRDGLISPADAEAAEELMQALHSAQRAAGDAALEYIAASIARGERPDTIKKRLTERIAKL
jgi:hypothetical protein